LSEPVKIDRRFKQHGGGESKIGSGSGRGAKEIDWAKVDQLLIAGCLGTEIAPHFDMHHDTFYRKVEKRYGVSFTVYSSQKKSKGESLLRAKQYEKALKGDNTLLIWLGKNRLKQRERELSEELDDPLRKLGEYIAKISSVSQSSKSKLEIEQSIFHQEPPGETSTVQNELGTEGAL